MYESILGSIKKLLGINELDTSFDADIIMHINTILGVLCQIGVGPEKPFMIKSDQEIWCDFLEDPSQLEMVKSHIFLRVQQLFDPSGSNQVLESQKNLINELEWRMFVETDEND